MHLLLLEFISLENGSDSWMVQQLLKLALSPTRVIPLLSSPDQKSQALQLSFALDEAGFAIVVRSARLALM